MSFDSTIKEIESQQTDIQDYVRFLDSLIWEKTQPENTIFVGTGDSLACASFVERLTSFSARSLDPGDLLQNSEIASGKDVYFISVSGKTKKNIEAAKLVKGISKRSVAVTADPESELAKNCTEVLPLRFSKNLGLTPGTNSFTVSLVACSRIFGISPKDSNFGEVIDKARKWGVTHSRIRGMVHFVSGGCIYPIAMYGAAKVFEFSGQKADYQLTEEFSHMNLFSMSNDDTVVILKSHEDDAASERLNEELVKEGFNSEILDYNRSGLLDRALALSIHLQYLALNMAIAKGLEQPPFLGNDRLLGISNRMIY